jgi:hypothetical protein
MGIFAGVFDPKIHGFNCAYKEWQELVRQAIEGALQDEQEWGERYSLDWDELRRQFPQLTLVEFVDACGRLSRRSDHSAGGVVP